MKDFEGQYSDEKLLLKSHENLLSFIIDKTHLFAIYSVLSGVLAIGLYYMYSSYILSTVILLGTLCILSVYLMVLYRNTWLIITTRRVLELTRNGLFDHHKHELKLTDIKATSTKRGILGTMFGFGRVTIKGTEENANIYFKGISESTNIINYLGRVLDYIKLNGHTDDIARYVPKKIRKKDR